MKYWLLVFKEFIKLKKDLLKSLKVWILYNKDFTWEQAVKNVNGKQKKREK